MLLQTNFQTKKISHQKKKITSTMGSVHLIPTSYGMSKLYVDGFFTGCYLGGLWRSWSIYRGHRTDVIPECLPPLVLSPVKIPLALEMCPADRNVSLASPSNAYPIGFVLVVTRGLRGRAFLYDGHCTHVIPEGFSPSRIAAWANIAFTSRNSRSCDCPGNEYDSRWRT